MADSIRSLWTACKRSVSAGALYVLFGTWLVKLIVMFSAIFLSRFMSKPDYGTLATIDNLMDLVLLASGLGLNSSILRYVALTDDTKRQRDIWRYCLTRGMAFNALCTLCLAVWFSLSSFGATPSVRPYAYLFILTPLLAFPLYSI